MSRVKYCLRYSQRIKNCFCENSTPRFSSLIAFVFAFSVISELSIFSISTAQEVNEHSTENFGIEEPPSIEEQKLEARKRFNEALNRKAQIEDERFRSENNKSGPGNASRKFLKGLGYTLLAIAAAYGVYQMVDGDGGSKGREEPNSNRMDDPDSNKMESQCDVNDDNKVAQAVRILNNCYDECGSRASEISGLRHDCLGGCESDIRGCNRDLQYSFEINIEHGGDYDCENDYAVGSLSYTMCSDCESCFNTCWINNNPDFFYSSCTDACSNDPSNVCLEEARRRNLF